MAALKRICLIYFFAFFGAAPAWAGPLAAPGDSGLRHDVQLLADAGVLSGPVSTWPLAWSQINDDLSQIPEDAQFAPAVAGALARVRGRLRANRHSANLRFGAFARGGTDPQFLRSFDDTPRAQAETGVYADWTGGHFAGRLQFTYAADPEDDKELRLDGSWIGAVLGNWMLAGGYIERYWGPAWQGGLIVSNNARPRPGLTLRRVRSTPFETKWLSWLGPWNFTLFTERLEDDRAVSNALLAGARFAFRPFQRLEIGISRTSQFGGDGRDVGFDTIVNVVTGQSTSTNPAVGSAEGINQLGGGDLRWHLPYVPYIDAAVYAEFIGEDESGSRPDLILAQGGMEFWGGIGDDGASWRLIYERTDTKANAFNGEDDPVDTGRAYNNSEFATGYRYRGRAIGHPADGDALLSSVRAIYVSPRGHQFRLVGTTGVVNRTRQPTLAIRNSLTPREEDVDSIDFGYAGQYRWARVDLGLGYTVRDFNGGEDDDIHAWLGLSREFE